MQVVAIPLDSSDPVDAEHAVKTELAQTTSVSLGKHNRHRSGCTPMIQESCRHRPQLNIVFRYAQYMDMFTVDPY